MPYTDGSAERSPRSDDASDLSQPDPNANTARIGELLRLQLWLEQPNLDLDAVRGYAANRLAHLPYRLPRLPPAMA